MGSGAASEVEEGLYFPIVNYNTRRGKTGEKGKLTGYT